MTVWESYPRAKEEWVHIAGRYSNKCQRDTDTSFPWYINQYIHEWVWNVKNIL